MSNSQTLDIPQSQKSNFSIEVRCPDCGSFAERCFNFTNRTTKTECPACDYKMVTDDQGKVIETYLPYYVNNK